MAEHQRPDKIPGYEHPTNSKYSRNGIYKTFTEGKKAKKKEKFGSTTIGKQYASYGDYNEDLCPECNDPSVNTCPCGYSDKRCGNAHVWYTDRDGNVKSGNPHTQ
jgi:hypothetical protein